MVFIAIDRISNGAADIVFLFGIRVLDGDEASVEAIKSFD